MSGTRPANRDGTEHADDSAGQPLNRLFERHRIAAGAGIALHELHTVTASLEEAFMTLTDEAAEYTSSAALTSPEP